MNIRGKYVQYSKVFTSLAGLAYITQVIVTIVLVCTADYAADALIEILKTTTGVMGIIFGCYSGNSAVEKVVTKSTQPPSGTAEASQVKFIQPFPAGVTWKLETVAALAAI